MRSSPWPRSRNCSPIVSPANASIAATSWAWCARRCIWRWMIHSWRPQCASSSRRMADLRPTAADSIYAAQAPLSYGYPSLGGHIEAEVAIVGGGYAGLATALGLAERGVKGVVLLEAERVGFGASGRNGGFVFGGYSLG